MKKLLTLNLILSLLAIWLTVGGGLPEALKAEAAKLNPVKKIDKTATLIPMGTAYSTSVVINPADLDVFYNFQSWPHSNNRKADDTMAQFIYQLARPTTYSYMANGFSINQISQNPNSNTMIDINGDGLLDMIYRDDADLFSQRTKMAIWINKGNNNFQLIYKCYVGQDEGWYGDCAAV